MPRWAHSKEARLQDLQRVPMGDQENVATGVPPFQFNDERRRPVKDRGDRLDAAADLGGVSLVGRPDTSVVVGRRSFPFPEAPLAEGLREVDQRRVEVSAHDLRRLPRAREVGRANDGVPRQTAGLCGLERLLAANLRQPVLAAPVILDPAHDDAGHVRQALPVPHDAEGVRKAIDAGQMVRGSRTGGQGSRPPIPAGSAPSPSPHSQAMISPAGRSRAER